MKDDLGVLDHEIEALLREGRAIRPVSDVVRARALARARATIAARIMPAPTTSGMAPSLGRHLSIALAAAVMMLLGAAGALAAFRGRAIERTPAAPAPSPPAGETMRDVGATSARPAGPAAAAPGKTAKAPVRTAAASRATYAAELALLERAQAAYGGGDFHTALALIAEHTRRFPNGRLTEEREALRVRSLAGSGRADDARRTTAAFAARFPRSVLLPHLRETIANLD